MEFFTDGLISLHYIGLLKTLFKSGETECGILQPCYSILAADKMAPFAYPRVRMTQRTCPALLKPMQREDGRISKVLAVNFKFFHRNCHAFLRSTKLAKDVLLK
ncbi:hypothetical protein AVEN_27353-1 [Araneus ventricosus]|uniref:Uncharacterized protein n=1 Tax=Araneus ventricosus TaxID=182803 RepID=A0A4Y2IR51_ARAVE|nr:hypothetical protein AVEN_27353-1 [Araneus ventricosus]